MKTLLKDFLRRYAVLLAIAGTAMCVLSITDVGGVAISTFWMFLGVATVIIEQSAGATRVKTAMPIPRGALAQMAWIQGVVAFPALYVCMSYPVIAIRALSVGTEGRMLAFQLSAPVMGIGFSAMAFLLMPLLWPTPGNILQQLRAFIVMVGYMVFLFAYDVLLLVRCEASESLYRILLHQEPSQTTTPGLAFLALTIVISLLLAIASFLLSRRVLEGMPLRPKSPKAAAASPPAAFPSRIVGFAAPWVRTTLSAAAMTLEIGVVLVFLAFLCHRVAGIPAGNKDLVFALSLIMLFLPVVLLLSQCGRWSGSIRGLRMLPMTRAQLSAVFLSFFLIPLAIAGAGFFLLARHLGHTAPLQATVSYVTLFLGWGCLSLVPLIRFGGVGTFLALVVLWGGPTLIWTVSAHEGSTSVAIDLAMVVTALAGVAMLHRAIGYSSDTYRRKPLLEDGPFGQP